MHGLHAQDLIVTLLIIEHRRRKVVEHVLVCQRSVGLGQRRELFSVRGEVTKCQGDLYPFVPNEKPMAIVVWGMEIVEVHSFTSLLYTRPPPLLTLWWWWWSEYKVFSGVNSK